MKFLAKYLNIFVLEQTYFLYVRPHLDYCDIIYHNQKYDLMRILESIQYKAALVVSGCWKGSNKQKLLDLLGWDSLAERRERRRLTHFFKVLNGEAPEYLLQQYHHFSLIKSETSTKRFKNSFFPDCINKWNKLSFYLTNSKNSKDFSNKLKPSFIKDKKKLFGIVDKSGIKLLFQLRVGFSDLREHRFRHNFNCSNATCA